MQKVFIKYKVSKPLHIRLERLIADFEIEKKEEAISRDQTIEAY
jgi:hypothetical protein